MDERDGQASVARSRRAVLAGGLGAAIGLAATAIAGPEPADAVTSYVALGSPNLTPGATTVASSDGATGLRGVSGVTTIGGATGIGETMIGVFGYEATTGTGVLGHAPTGVGVSGIGNKYGVEAYSLNGEGVHSYSGESTAVRAISSHGVGVRAESGTGIGMLATSTSGVGAYATSKAASGVIGLATGTSTQPGVYGRSSMNCTGVAGVSAGTSGGPASTPARTGVYGWATQDGAARGVWGETAAGAGVYGHATSGIGVQAHSVGGTAIYASTGGLKTGLALRARGRVLFDSSVGIATIPKGSSSVVVTPGIDLVSTSAVVATLQGGAGGSTAVRCAVVNATTDTFTIYLTAAATVAVKVAWHVFG